jgi:hypothetical protein
VTYIVSGIYKWRREDAEEIDKTQQQSAATVSKVSTEFGKTCHPNRLSDARRHTVLGFRHRGRREAAAGSDDGGGKSCRVGQVCLSS